MDNTKDDLNQNKTKETKKDEEIKSIVRVVLINTGFVCFLLQGYFFGILFVYLFVCMNLGWLNRLTTETVQGAALAFKGMYHIQSSYGLATSMLSVGNSVTDDVLQEHFQDTTSFLVDKA